MPLAQLNFMSIKEITFRISRFKPGVIDPPEFMAYVISVTETMTVLDCLEKIRLEQEPTLMYRHSCHHSSCGTCACLINGVERLACITNVWDLDDSTVNLEPLRGFERIGDLAVNVQPIFKDIGKDWSYLQPSKSIGETSGSDRGSSFTRFENCIECGSCISACPVSESENRFIGPAAMAALHREILKSPRKEAELLKTAGGKRGERLCQRALACSRVCPTKVYPARHIADLRRKLNKK